MNIKRTLLVLSVALIFSGISLHMAYAQSSNPDAGGLVSSDSGSGFVSLASYQNAPGFTSTLNSTSLPQYINNVFKIVLSVGGILAVLRIAYAGYMYMGSADMWGNKQHAKEILSDAIIGLLLLFGIYLILNQINPNLLNLDILKNINNSSGTNTVTSTASPANQPPSQFNSTGGPANGTGCQSGIIKDGVCTTN